MAAIYLIPVSLGDGPLERVLPAYNKEIVLSLQYFIVENERTARRFLKKTDPSIKIESLHFSLLNKHTSPDDISGFLAPLQAGHSIGVISEAGCPAVADPGADIVRIAQQKKYPVVPLVGPSSILLSLMASGFNGQNFAFVGYLPVDRDERSNTLRRMEQRVYTEHQTQIFIETPYRNNKLIDDILQHCKPSTRLCIAANLTCDGEFIRTLSIAEWKGKVPDLAKQPCVFLLYK